VNIYKHLQELKNISTPNKYTNCYISLIEQALKRFKIDDSVQIIQNTRRARKQLGYVEGHHIIPRSIRPEFSNNHFNIVYLTAKEHFIAHLLLTKMFLGKEQTKMIFAFRRIQHDNNGKRYTSRLFSNLKSQMPPANLGKIQITDGVNTRLHLKSKPIPVGWIKGAGSLYKDARRISNKKLHCKTYKILNIIQDAEIVIDNLKEWSISIGIPYSTLTCAVRSNSIVRNTFIITEVST
jgi:hypothetical protein